MAFTPDIRRYGQAVLTINAALGTRTVTATHSGGTTCPNSHIDGTSFSVTIAETTTGVTPPTGQWRAYLVEDDDDVSNNYETTGAGGTLSANVLAGVALGTGGALSTSITFGAGSGINPAINPGGTYRIVLTAGNADPESRRASEVDTGGASVEYHADSDGNTTRGALAVVTSASNRIIGGCGHRVVLTARSGHTGNKKYRDTLALALSIRPANALTAAIINPKELKARFRTTNADGTGTKIVRGTPNTTGDVTLNFPIDTDFGQVLGGTDYFTHIGVNDCLGDTVTPANETAGIWSTGTIEGVTTAQRSAYVFSGPTMADASGNAAVGIVIGTPTISGGFLECDGVDANDASQGVVQTGTLTGTSSWKLECKYRRDRVNLVEVPFAWFDPNYTGSGGAGSGENGILPTHLSDGTCTFQFFNDSVVHSHSIGALPAGTYTLSVELSGTNYTVKKDTVTVASGTLPFAFPTIPLKVTAGRLVHGAGNAGSPFPCDCGIDYVELIRNSVQALRWDMTGFAGGVGAASGVDRASGNRLVSSAADMKASAAVQAFKNSTLTTLGVNTYLDSARTQLNRFFKRTGPTNTAAAIVYFRVFMADAYGVAFANTSNIFVRDVLRHSDSAVENTATLSTSGGTGLMESNYTVAATHTAFNRWKTAHNTVDNEASPPATIPVADAFGSNPFSNTAFSDPYPVYPKAVRYTGNGFSAGKEPSVTVSAVFGVNSEGRPGRTRTAGGTLTGGTWSGNATQATEAANDAPNGIGARTKALGSGSLRLKPWTSEYDEGTSRLVDVTRFSLRDTASRQISAATDLWFGKYGVFNTSLGTFDTAMADMSDTGGNDMRLQGTLGYSPAFISINAPSDPAIQAFIVGFADTLAQRTAFGATSSTVYGYSADSGNYGALTQTFNWITVDPDLNFFVTSDRTLLAPGQSMSIQAQMIRLLPDGSHVRTQPDGNILRIKLFKRNPSGDPTSIYDADMSTVDGFNYTYTRTFAADGSENGAYGILVTGFQNGSRPPDAGDVDFVVGVRDERVGLRVIPRNLTNPNRHVNAGDQLAVTVHAVNTSNGTVLDLDASPAPKTAWRRVSGGVPQYLAADLTWKNAVTQGPITYFNMTLDATNKLWSHTVTSDSTWTNDFQNPVVANYGQVVYESDAEREVTGSSNSHDAAPYGLKIGPFFDRS